MQRSDLPAAREMSQTDAALAALLQELKQRSYAFVTPTPATHARIVSRPRYREASDLRDILGWSVPFDPLIVEPGILRLLETADALEPAGNGRFKSRYRVAILGDDLFLHSAYPTQAEDAVFFGPDSYRFASLVRRELTERPPLPGAHLVDVGAGAGAGAIAAARCAAQLRITMTDINPAALRLARVNAHVAGVTAGFVESAYLAQVADPIDVALANPPYIVDAAGRDYRDGGDMHGGRVAYEMAAAALDRLAPGGRFILYTGSAIVGGGDQLRDALAQLTAETGDRLRYDEIDPDVFGEELDNPPYRAVERIALVSAVISRPGR